MIKKRIRQFLAGICTILVLPIGPVCEVFAKEEKQENPVSTEAINQSLKLWYTSPANINTQETHGGEWMGPDRVYIPESGNAQYVCGVWNALRLHR